MNRQLELDEIKKCLKAWREYENEEAYELLIINNLGLVTYLAKRYLGKGLTFDELKSAGQFGLIKAINKFDYNNHEIEKFSTYISTSIENEIKMELKKYNKHKNVLSFEEPLGYNKNGDELRIEDIVGTDENIIVDEILSNMKIKFVKEVLDSLTTREKEIILLRYAVDDIHRKTQEEIAKIYGCSKSTIAKQEQKALRKIRQPINTRKLKDFIEE